MHKCTLGRVIEFWLSVFKSCHYCSTSSRYEKSFDKDESSAITQMGLLILQKSVRASRFLPPRDFSKTIKPWFFELFFGALPFCSLKQTWMAHRGHSTLRRRHETHSPAPHCFFCCFWYCSFILYLFIFPYFCERVQHWRLSHWTSSQVRCTGASVDTFRAPCLCSRPVPAPHRRFVLIRSSRRSSEHQRHVLLWPSHESLDEVKNNQVMFSQFWTQINSSYLYI